MSIKVNHVGIVVHDLDEVLALYRDVVGLPVKYVTEDTTEEVRIAFLPTDKSDIELIQPTTSDSGIAKFLDKRGEGMHHICLEVESIEATVKEYEAKGIEVLGEPKVNGRGKKYVFIHPKSMYGVLIELYETPTDEK